VNWLEHRELIEGLTDLRPNPCSVTLTYISLNRAFSWL